MNLLRRQALLTLLSTAVTSEVWSSSTPPVSGSIQQDRSGFWTAPRWLWARHAVTGELLRLTYWENGKLNETAHREASWFLRDRRFEAMLREQSPVLRAALGDGRISREQLTPWMLVDPFLLDILYAYSTWLQLFGIKQPLQINSGFRHPLTNAMTEGAARNSWHTRGAAADIVIPGVSVGNIAAFGKWLRGGGVGVYTDKGFVHVDRGAIRSWSGAPS